MIITTIKEPLQKRARKEQFKITVEYMHGDADAYSTETFHVPYANMKKLEALIRSIEFMLSPTFPPAWEPSSQRAACVAFAAAAGVEQLDEYTSTFQDLLSRDTTDSTYQTFASIQSFNVTYFDTHGVEHEVQYTLEDHHD